VIVMAQNETEYLLDCLAEECAEIVQRVEKAKRFTLAEVQPGQDLSNQARIRLEVLDLLTICSMLRDRGVELFNLASNADMRHMRDKHDKVLKFMTYSRELGALE
jgi:NTP pyrophosphatase (non-canonical NTP hydrolase)